MMRYLFSGCVAGVVVFTGGVSHSQDFKVIISGRSDFEAYFSQQKMDGNTRGVDFRNRIWLDVTTQAKGLDGAITYGAHTRFKTENGDGTVSSEDTNIYVSGDFGRVSVGNGLALSGSPATVKRPQDWVNISDGVTDYLRATNDSSVSLMNASGQTTSVGNKTYANYAFWVAKPYQLAPYRWDSASLGDKSNRINYLAPAISGFQFGASYFPRGFSTGWNFNRSASNKNQDGVELVGKFDSTDKSFGGKFGNYILKTSFSYNWGRDGDHAGGYGYENPKAMTAGLDIGYGNFLIGGHYIDFGKSDVWKGDRDQVSNISYALGAQYRYEDFVFGVGYNYYQQDTSAFTSYDTNGKMYSKIYSAGVKYNLSRGVDVYLNYDYVINGNTGNRYTTRDANGNLNPDTYYTPYKDLANVVIVATRISF